MATPTSKATLIEYCKRRLGAPVIEINVDDDQVEDRVDEAIQYYREYHDDGTYRAYLKHLVTATDVTNKYITIPAGTHFVTKMFKTSSALFSRNMFSIKYQMHMNDIANMTSYIGDLAYFQQIQQYLSTLDMQLNGTPQVNFVRQQNRLYIHGEFEDEDVKAGEYIVMEAYLIIDGNTYTLREVLMGSTVTNDEGSLEIFTTTTTNEFNDEIIIQGIRLLNSSRKPKFWLDTNRGTLSVPWRYMGSSKYVDQSYYSEHLFYKE